MKINVMIENKPVEVGDKFQSKTGELIHVLNTEDTIEARINGSAFCIAADTPYSQSGVPKLFGKRITDEEYKIKLDDFWYRRDTQTDRIE